MLQFHKGGWKHRAVWGDDDAIPFGTPNTTERRRTWGRCRSRASGCGSKSTAAKSGLKPGDQVTGLAFTQFGGTVYWDKIGVIGRSDPAADPSRSLAAWCAAQRGQAAEDLPGELQRAAQEGRRSDRTPEEQKRLRDYYLADRLRRDRGRRSRRCTAELARPQEAARRLRRDRPGDVRLARPAASRARRSSCSAGSTTSRARRSSAACPRSCRRSKRPTPTTADAARPRALARGARASAHRARGGQPVLAAVLRHRAGEDQRRLRLAGRAAEPSGAARLAGGRLSARAAGT